MKTVAAQYHATIAQAKRCKPRSKRKTILINRATNLLVRQLKIECRRSA